MGHVVLTPQVISMLGGFRPQGKTVTSAFKVLETTIALKEAGCFSVVLECVPVPVATATTSVLQIPTIGIGAGPFYSGQLWPSPLPKQFFQIPTIGIGAGPFCSGQVAMEMYASLDGTLIYDDYLDYIGTPKRQCYGNIYEVGNGWKDWKIFSDKLREKKEELYDLDEEFEPENKKQRERFKEKVMSHSSDGEHFTENDSLKIETWYFLTITEATEHLLFDKYLEFCPFIKDDKCSASDIEGLKKHFSLPDELILNGIKRKINQHKALESRRKFAMVKKFLVKNDYLQWGSSVSDMLPRLKEEMKSRGISDDMLKDCLDSYRKEFIVVADVPDRLSADCRKCFEHIILQKINMSCDIWCEDIKKEWEIEENDGLVYYTVFNNFPWKHEKLECFEHILLQRNDDSYKCSCEGIKQIFYSLTKEEKIYF